METSRAPARAETLAFVMAQNHDCPDFRSGCVLCEALRSFEAGVRPVGLDVPPGPDVPVAAWHEMVKNRLLIAAGKRKDPWAGYVSGMKGGLKRPGPGLLAPETRSAWQARVRAAHNERRGWTTPDEERTSILADKAAALTPLIEETGIACRSRGRKTLALVLAGLHELGDWMSGRGQISHERLACVTGTSRATVKRVLRRLRTAGLIVSTRTTRRASGSKYAKNPFGGFGTEPPAGRQGANVIRLSEEVIRICQGAYRAWRRKTAGASRRFKKTVNDPLNFPGMLTRILNQ